MIRWQLRDWTFVWWLKLFYFFKAVTSGPMFIFSCPQYSSLWSRRMRRNRESLKIVYEPCSGRTVYCGLYTRECGSLCSLSWCVGLGASKSPLARQQLSIPPHAPWSKANNTVVQNHSDGLIHLWEPSVHYWILSTVQCCIFVQSNWETTVKFADTNNENWLFSAMKMQWETGGDRHTGPFPQSCTSSWLRIHVCSEVCANWPKGQVHVHVCLLPPASQKFPISYLFNINRFLSCKTQFDY